MQTLQVIHRLYLSFFGNGSLGIVFLIALVYLLFKKKRTKAERELGMPAAIILAVILCPVSAWVIMRGIGEDVFWRTFWMLPLVTVISYVLTLVTERVPRGIRRFGALAGIVLAVALNGSLVLGDAFFTYRENNYKLPQDVIEAVDVINAHVQRYGVKKKRVVGPTRFATFSRLYDPSVVQPYGRDSAMKEELQTELYRQINAQEPDYKLLAKEAKKEKCRYLVLPLETDDREAMLGRNYECIGQTGAYAVYFARRYYKAIEKRRLKNIETGLEQVTFREGEWTLTQYGPRDVNSMFYTIYDPGQGLIVVDGGWQEDEDYVRAVIRALGNHVDAWIITHPHMDHCGAFNAIMAAPGSINVDAVYAGPMASPADCLEVAAWDSTQTYEDFLALSIPQLQYVQRGQTFALFDLQIQVLNAFDEQVRRLSRDYLNDGSMMFKVTAPNHTMLFCGDVGEAMSDLLRDTYADILSVDYVQMGHHGNGGLKEDFYRLTAPEVAFFDAPDWLMEDPEGKYNTPAKIALMTQLGSRIVSFRDAPGSVTL